MMEYDVDGLEEDQEGKPENARRKLVSASKTLHLFRIAHLLTSLCTS